MSNAILSTLFVVLLHELMVHGDPIPEGTTLEVDRAVRNDWVGSKLARDATEAEKADYLGEALVVHDEETATSLAALQAELESLESQRQQAQKEVDDLQGQLGELTTQKATLAKEVADLEAAKAAAVEAAAKAAKK